MGEYINPEKIANPRSPAEKLRASLFKNMPTNEMVTRLKDLEPKASLSDVGNYIGKKLSSTEELHPYPEFRGKSVLAAIDYYSKLQKLFDQKKFKPLIKIFVKNAINQWNGASKADENIKNLTKEDLETQEINRIKGIEHNRQEIEKMNADPSYRPDVDNLGTIRLGGDQYREKAEAYIHFAAVLAKEI